MKLRFPVLTMIFLACVPFAAHAGAGPPVGIPIDGGLSLLVAAGIGYGVKKAYDKRKKDKISNEGQE